MKHPDSILVLDFGSQYTQLIARRIRELHVYCEIHPFSHAKKAIKSLKPKGIILSGGPSSVEAPGAPLIDKEIINGDVPVLGICYGMQLITKLLGGRVGAAHKKEYGRAVIDADTTSLLFSGLEAKQTVWMSHGDRIEDPPKGFTPIAKTDNSPYAAFSNTDLNCYAVQFHPEVVHTEHGMEILKNFVLLVCHCDASWTMRSYIDQAISEIRTQVGSANVVCGVSGGVDSTVAAVLIHRAIGDQLHCIFVDNGVVRKDEGRFVVERFKKNLGINLHAVDAVDRFLEKLAGVVDPEQKRKIIGNEFIAVFEEEANKIPNVEFLAQGTLYPDVIESVSVKGPSAMIKSHHNVGGLPDVMKLELVEPLRELFKDEVRDLGREMDIPAEAINRQPFPGPGLAVRIIGEITKERLDVLREADVVVVDEFKKAGLYEKVWQSFAVLLPIQTVGVMGDERTYENVIALRVVNSQDGMTADWVPVPYDLLGRISNRIINEVRGVNRVVYDISSKPPSTIEWE